MTTTSMPPEEPPVETLCVDGTWTVRSSDVVLGEFASRAEAILAGRAAAAALGATSVIRFAGARRRLSDVA